MLSAMLLAIFVIAMTSPLVISQTITQGAYTLFGRTDNEYVNHCLDGSGSGNIFATGYTTGSSLGQDTVSGGAGDWFILKYSKNNGFLSSNANNPTIRWLLTPQLDYGNACDSDVNGAVYVGGTTAGTLDPTHRTNNGNSDSVIAKYDANMNLVWIYQFDATGDGNSDSVIKIILYGAVVYVFGNIQTDVNGNYHTYIHTLDAGSGLPIFASPMIIATTSGISTIEANIDVFGHLHIVGITYSQIPSVSVLGTTILAVCGNGVYDGFVITFDNNGNRLWQACQGTAGYDQAISVTSDITGAVYVGGSTTGSFNGATYTPGTAGYADPFLVKYDQYGNMIWTRIFANTDGYMFQRLVVDNIGGLFALLIPITANTASTTNYYTYAFWPAGAYGEGYPQTMFLWKLDINGALIWNTNSFSTGVPYRMTIDNTGLLTFSGIFGNSQTFHGLQSSGTYDGFIDQQLIAYNCSCGNLASLVQQMSTLLNIVPQ